MSDIAEFLKRLNGLHASIANDVYPNGVTLTCRECGKKEEATTEDCAYYLAHGWPKHCGRDMLTNAEKATR